MNRVMILNKKDGLLVDDMGTNPYSTPMKHNLLEGMLRHKLKGNMNIIAMIEVPNERRFIKVEG